MEQDTRILVVEDNPDDQALLRHMFKKSTLAGKIEITGDGREALQYLTSHELETARLLAVFLDLNIPSISGIELLKKIRSDDRLVHLPVIVMTSSNSPDDLETCRKLGVSCYLKKPLTISTFTSAIAHTFHSDQDTDHIPRTF